MSKSSASAYCSTPDRAWRRAGGGIFSTADRFRRGVAPAPAMTGMRPKSVRRQSHDTVVHVRQRRFAGRRPAGVLTRPADKGRRASGGGLVGDRLAERRDERRACAAKSNRRSEIDKIAHVKPFSQPAGGGGAPRAKPVRVFAVDELDESAPSRSAWWCRRRRRDGPGRSGLRRTAAGYPPASSTAWRG
jgi:hypothetical protein